MQINVTDTKWVDISIVDARTLRVTHNFEAPKITTENKKITEVHFINYNIKAGSKIEVTFKNKLRNYQVQQINQTQQGFDIISTTLTKSSIFLLPLIGKRNDVAQLYEYDTYFYNAYLYNGIKKEYSDGKHLCLVYRFFDTERYKMLENYLTKNANYVETIEPNKDFSVYVFEIPRIHHSDAFYFNKGKYSFFSPTAKSKIIIFHKAKADDWLSLVLHKHKMLRNMMENDLGCDIPEELDLCDKPIKELEYYI